MIFATFYQGSAVDPAKLVEACGDRATIILDGRNSGATQHNIAEAECAKRGYLAYQRHRGPAISRPSWSGLIFTVGR